MQIHNDKLSDAYNADNPYCLIIGILTSIAHWPGGGGVNQAASWHPFDGSLLKPQQWRYLNVWSLGA